MDDIYVLTDGAIMSKIGSHLKGVRLKQNITQQSLAESSGVSLSSLKKIEKGERCEQRGFGGVSPRRSHLFTFSPFHLFNFSNFW